MDIFFGIVIGVLIVGGLVWARAQFLDFLAQKPEDYTANQPEFDIRTHLKGPIDCEGVIFGPTGKVSSRFVAEFNATWDGDSGVMTESFSYDSGATQDREWRLTVGEGGRIRADADDLVGAGRGQQAGSGVCLNYAIRLPESAGGHVLDVVDWMYLMENGTIMNRSQFRKFGIKVAELVATMRPRAAEENQRDAA